MTSDRIKHCVTSWKTEAHVESMCLEEGVFAVQQVCIKLMQICCDPFHLADYASHKVSHLFADW
jgi:hypothetical protein